MVQARRITLFMQPISPRMMVIFALVAFVLCSLCRHEFGQPIYISFNLLCAASIFCSYCSRPNPTRYFSHWSGFECISWFALCFLSSYVSICRISIHFPVNGENAGVEQQKKGNHRRWVCCCKCWCYWMAGFCCVRVFCALLEAPFVIFFLVKCSFP